MRNDKFLALMTAIVLLSRAANAAESIEFIAEHLPEVAMDNRYASLPLWMPCEGQTADGAVRSDDRDGHEACIGANAGYARTQSGTLSLDGPMIALSAGWRLNDAFRLTAFAFFDDFGLASGIEHRPLEVTFAAVPLALPAEGEFTGLDGTGRDVGLGLALNGSAHWHWLPRFEWSTGVLWQQVTLSHYQLDYRLLEGPDAGTTGTVDYSATYTHFAPFLGAGWPREHGAWTYVPHFQVVMPLPRRGFEGRITGPGFDIAGSTADRGNTPFGDPSLTFGFNVTYVPWHLTIDLGSTITQALLESKIHEGVNRNLMLVASWEF